MLSIKRTLVAVLALATATLSTTAVASDARSALPLPLDLGHCVLPGGDLNLVDVPRGTRVSTCGIVGRTVVHLGLKVKVPGPGQTTSVEVFRADGDLQQLTVTVAADGTIDYSTDDPHDGEAQLAAASPAPGASAEAPECDNPNYRTIGWKQYSTWRWYLGDGVRPAGTTLAEFKPVAVDGINNITGASNDCGRPDNVSATASYQGTTWRESNMVNRNGEHSCVQPDGFSVIDAGLLGEGVLAAACMWLGFSSGPSNSIVEADVRFDTNRYNFTLTPRDGSCNRLYDVESVLTHEIGHVFGLGHVSEDHNPRMTMSTQVAPCDNSARTLGKGDMLGLESMY